MKRHKKKIAIRTEVEPESDEFFAYIAGYTAGGWPYGITWEEVRAMEQAEAEAGIGPTLDDFLEFSPEDVVGFFARHGISVEASLKNGGLSVFVLPGRIPLVRLVPVGKNNGVVNVLSWSHREHWEDIGDFGGIDMPLREALQYVIDDEPGCFGVMIF